MNFNEHFFVNHDHKLVFFPINKNASTTYIQFFKTKIGKGWEHTDEVSHHIYDYHWFAHIQNPTMRYYKGIAEVIDTNKLLPYLTQSPINQFIIRLYHDKHLTSVTDMFGDKVACINFLPCDTDSRKVTYDFLRRFNLEYPELLKFNNMNVAKRRKKVVQNRVREVINDNPKAAEVFKKRIVPFYDKDKELWVKAQENVGKWPYAPTYNEYFKNQRLLEEKMDQDLDHFWERFRYAMKIMFKS